MEYVITFYTHFDALQCDKFLKKKRVKGKLQPVPRVLSSSCGTCIKFQSMYNSDNLFDFSKIEYEKIFVKNNKGDYLLIAENI